MAKAQTSAQTTAQDYPPLSYEVRINTIRPEGTVKATASVDINGQFAVRSVKVMEGSNGLFVSVPSYKNGNGEYKDIAFPCTKEAKAAFDKAVMGAYEQALTQSQSSAPSRKTAPDPFEQPAFSGQKM